MDYLLLRTRFSFLCKGEKAVKFKELILEPAINRDLFTLKAGHQENSVHNSMNTIGSLGISTTTPKKPRAPKPLRRVSRNPKAKAAKVEGDHGLTSELAKGCNDVIKEDIEEGRASV
ncbi:hypothetical protein Y032_0316g2277 [Ancylostoma ceylanicum]|uniref:Uncharacterized protein n=1 Tax=Ancylostoma ceylanicum TaxID=53326 RepID=A0A016S2F5_9BILA|nr:hypothetical protein Y032_0316g2277 [Ancylostoma ceylanicum]